MIAQQREQEEKERLKREEEERIRLEEERKREEEERKKREEEERIRKEEEEKKRKEEEERLKAIESKVNLLIESAVFNYSWNPLIGNLFKGEILGKSKMQWIVSPIIYHLSMEFNCKYEFKSYSKRKVHFWLLKFFIKAFTQLKNQP